MFRSEKPYDRTGAAGCTAAKVCESRDYGCSVYGTKFGVYSAQAGGRCAKESKTEDDEKNKDLFRYVITSKRSYGDRC